MSKDNTKLSKDYVYELIACCLKHRKVLDICHTHLKYEFLETEAQKRVVKYIFDTYSLRGVSPTFGEIAQVYSVNEQVIQFLTKIKKVKVQDGTELGVLDTFEAFIKDMKFQQLYYRMAKLYNDDKTEEAIALLAKESQEIATFNIKAKRFVEVFTQFDERMAKREKRAEEDSVLFEKLTTGIHEFNQHLRGGFKKGTSFLVMARSGVGKSTYLRWVALANARLGRKVVVFQNESTEDEAMDTFDAAWTGVTIENIEEANIDEQVMKQVKKVRDEIKRRGGRIYVVPTESFSRQTIEECNDILDEIDKLDGGKECDMVLWDYLEIFDAKGQWGKGESAERRRREAIAEKITAIATSRKCVTGTATQSADIKMELINNPDFNMTRSDASEFKNVIKPFSYFFTLNATEEEYDAQHLRIFLDKCRKYPRNKVFKIAQAREVGRFVDTIQTKILFYDYNAVNIR